MGRRWRAGALCAATVTLALSCTAAASRAQWGQPLSVGELNGLGPSVDLADDGTVRIVKGVTRPGVRVEVPMLGPGSSKVRRCDVADRTPGAFTARVASGAGASGAMALAWGLRTEADAPDRVLAVSAAPGKCFTGAQVLSTKGRQAALAGARAGAGGTTLVAWAEASGTTDVYRYAVGRGGSRFGKSRKFAPRGSKPGPFALRPSFIGSDRVLWTWLTQEGEGERQVTRLWAATSAPRAGGLGRARQIAKRVGEVEAAGPDPVGASLVTDSRGGQVAVRSFADRLHVWAREPGKPFGAPRVIPLPEPAGLAPYIAAATNPGGDAVFAVEASDDVYALVRRRDGRLSALQHLTPGDEPRVAAEPAAAMGGDGRAVVVWRGQARSSEQTDDSDIHAAVASTKGNFGLPVVVSGAGTEANETPYVAANASGGAAIVWTRLFVNATGIQSAPVHVVRGRLGG